MSQYLYEGKNFLIDLFNTFPFPTMVVDNEVRILFWNSAAGELIKGNKIYKMRGGEVLHCIHSSETAEGCGHAPYCKECIIRNSVNESIQGKRAHRKKYLMELQNGKSTTVVPLLVTALPFNYNGQLLSLLVLEDISELMQLGNLLPICAKCKKIRTEDNKWEQIEHYIKTHFMEIDFTHGLCPDCLKETFPGITTGKQ